MKTHLKTITACLTLSTVLLSCQKENKAPSASSNVSQDVINQIAAQGYSTDQILVVKGGYVVEGDIFLSAEELNNASPNNTLRVGDEEQYHTTNLIKSLPRTITVSVTGLAT